MAFSASTTGALPLLTPAKTRNGFDDRTIQACCHTVRVHTQYKPSSSQSRNYKLAISGPTGFGKQLQHIIGRNNCYTKQSASVTCSASMNARCSASGQTQTIKREDKTIEKLPVRDITIKPIIDDRGGGFPPRNDGGGGGGGGGGGNWSGGFFLFGFLGFLGFLKDIENEMNGRGSRRR